MEAGRRYLSLWWLGWLVLLSDAVATFLDNGPLSSLSTPPFILLVLMEVVMFFIGLWMLLHATTRLHNLSHETIGNTFPVKRVKDSIAFIHYKGVDFGVYCRDGIGPNDMVEVVGLESIAKKRRLVGKRANDNQYARK